MAEGLLTHVCMLISASTWPTSKNDAAGNMIRGCRFPAGNHQMLLLLVTCWECKDFPTIAFASEEGRAFPLYLPYPYQFFLERIVILREGRIQRIPRRNRASRASKGKTEIWVRTCQGRPGELPLSLFGVDHADAGVGTHLERAEGRQKVARVGIWCITAFRLQHHKLG